MNQDTTTLFVDYLNTCNAAIDAHKTEFPFDKIIQAGEKLLRDKKLGVAIYKDDASTPYDFFTIKLENGALHLVEHGKADPDIVWKTSRPHLEKVVDNKQEFITHPAKLDLDWLKSRVGIA